MQVWSLTLHTVDLAESQGRLTPRGEGSEATGADRPLPLLSDWDQDSIPVACSSMILNVFINKTIDVINVLPPGSSGDPYALRCAPSLMTRGV